MPKDNYTLVVSKHLASIGMKNEEVYGLANVLRDAGYCVEVLDNRVAEDDLTLTSENVRGIPKF